MDKEPCRWSCLEEKAQVRSTSEVVAESQDLMALTGGAGRFELDGVNLWDDLPLFMLQTRALLPMSTPTYGPRPRPAVRPCVGAMVRPSVDERRTPPRPVQQHCHDQRQPVVQPLGKCGDHLQWYPRLCRRASCTEISHLLGAGCFVGSPAAKYSLSGGN
jgi:hypothetical protein